jgi:hypothetical protein
MYVFNIIIVNTVQYVTNGSHTLSSYKLFCLCEVKFFIQQTHDQSIGKKVLTSWCVVGGVWWVVGEGRAQKTTTPFLGLLHFLLVRGLSFTVLLTCSRFIKAHN